MPARLKPLARKYTGRLLTGGFLTHAVLLVLLLAGLLAAEASRDKAAFVARAREKAELLASRFDARRAAAPLPRLLDEMLLGGQADYADYLSPAGRATAAGGNGRQARFQEDLAFGQHGDHVYYVAAPAAPAGGRLRLGFSELPVEEELAQQSRLALLLGAAYLCVVLLSDMVFGDRLRDSILRLQSASRRITDGRIHETMTIDTKISEFHDLSVDLDQMRRTLLRREQAIARREAWHRAVLETAAEGIVTVNPEGRIESFNKAAETLFGCSAGEAAGLPFSHFLAPEEAGRFLAPGGEPAVCRNAQFMGRRHSGQTLHLMLSVSEVAATGLHCFTILAYDMSQRLAHEAHLAHQATHDPLTGLPNRALYQDRLGQVLAHGAREGHSVGVLFLDLDRFKAINDSLGHHVGDQVLQAAARRLKGCLRSEDTLARLGGDEFTIILPHLEKATNAVTVAENIVRSLEKPFPLAGRELFISCSIGIAFFPADGRDVAELSRNADSAMYATKGLGGHGFQFYSKAMNARAATHIELESGLRQALEREELRLHYQPVVDTATLQVVGVEALVRWQHPEKGLLAPEAFLPLAEESGLAVPLGEWVLATACRQGRAWLDEGLPVTVGVNLSAGHFREPGFVEALGKCLAESGFPPGRLCLELGEETVMARCGETEATLLQFQQMGIALGLDDLGTGLSSLTCLRRHPIATLKIDRAFVHAIDAGDGALAATVVAVARCLERQVVAKGVETPSQLAFLAAHGCSLCQGFLFSRPLDAPEMTALLRRGGLAERFDRAA